MLRCAKAGVRTPCVYMVDQQRSRIYMEKVEGHTLKHFLRDRYDPGTGRYGDVAIATVVRFVGLLVCVFICLKRAGGLRPGDIPPPSNRHLPSRTSLCIIPNRPPINPSPQSSTRQRQLGRAIAKIHDAEVVHGDLTTSNFLVVESEPGKEKEEGWQLVSASFGRA